jgi:hypothetical protein
MNGYTFWAITPCISVTVNRRFGGTCYDVAGTLFGLLFDREDGGNMFLLKLVYFRQKKKQNYIPEDITLQANMNFACLKKTYQGT